MTSLAETTSVAQAQPAARPRTARRTLEQAAVYLFLIVVSFLILVPFVWPVLSAFTHKPENVSSLYLYWPKSFTLDHFYDAIVGRGQALTLLRNSLVLTFSSVLFALAICALGGYSLSRGTFPISAPSCSASCCCRSSRARPPCCRST